MSLVGNWQREAAKFAPALRVYAHHGRERLHGDGLEDRLAETDLIATTYATATRDIEELAEYQWDRVVLDEAQADKSQWAAVERALAENALFAAALLADERPADIEDVFDAVGLTLFPTAARELSLDCSCPDDAVPCKHLAATFYLLAESFDEDPFAILAWRGREREDLLENLAAARSGGGPAADRAGPSGPALADCLDSFCAAGRYSDVQPAGDLADGAAGRTAGDAGRRARAGAGGHPAAGV